MACTIDACHGCNHKIIENEEVMKCAKCKNLYDLICAGLTKAKYKALSSEFVRSWICVACRSKLPKSRDVDTPVRLLMSNHDACTNTKTGSTSLASTSSATDTDVSCTSAVSRDTASRSAAGGCVNITTEATTPCTTATDHAKRSDSRDTNKAETDDTNNITIHRGSYVARRQQMMKNAPTSHQSNCLCGNLDSIRAIVREELQIILTGPIIDSLCSRLVENVTVACVNILSNSPKLSVAVPTVEETLMQHTSDDSKTKPAKDMNAEKAARKKKETNGKRENKVQRTSACRAVKCNLPTAAKRAVVSLPVTNEMVVLPPPGLATVEAIGGCEESDASGDWTVVKGGRGSLRASQSGAQGVRSGTASPDAFPLRAAERRQHLHLYYLMEGTTESEVRAHLTTICGEDVCSVEALKARGSYASFKLGVPSKLAEHIQTPANWARGICVKPWRQNFRAKCESESL